MTDPYFIIAGRATAAAPTVAAPIAALPVSNGPNPPDADATGNKYWVTVVVLMLKVF